MGRVCRFIWGAKKQYFGGFIIVCVCDCIALCVCVRRIARDDAIIKRCVCVCRVHVFCGGVGGGGHSAKATSIIE